VRGGSHSRFDAYVRGFGFGIRDSGFGNPGFGILDLGFGCALLNLRYVGSLGSGSAWPFYNTGIFITVFINFYPRDAGAHREILK
jgi:hypothetical protein